MEADLSLPPLTGDQHALGLGPDQRRTVAQMLEAANLLSLLP